MEYGGKLKSSIKDLPGARVHQLRAENLGLWLT